jgi:hypothetical protein
MKEKKLSEKIINITNLIIIVRYNVIVIYSSWSVQ